MPKARVRKKPTLGKNGRVLTAKHVPEKDYQTIHQVPYGMREAVLLGLLRIATKFSQEYGDDWYDAVAKGHVGLAL